MAIVLLAPVAGVLLWVWWPLLVQQGAVRRAAIGCLRLLRAVIVLGGVGSCAGCVVLGIWLWGARRRRRRRPLVARLLLASAATLLALMIAQVAASTYTGWMHRIPRLPTQFADDQQMPALPSELVRTPRDTVRLLVLGGSSALGSPYDPWLSVGQIVAWQLEQLFPGRRFEVDMRARPGVALKAMHLELAQLRRRPDAIIVYAGHNEFQKRYSWSRSVPYYRDDSWVASRETFWRRTARLSPLGRLIQETLDQQEVALPPDLKSARTLVDRPTCTAEEYEALRNDFHRRLEAIAAYCDQIGSLPILMMPASNDGGFEPSRSVLDPATSARQRAEFERNFEAARKLEATEPARAETAYAALLEQQPLFAEGHFRLARLLERRGAGAAADRHYRQARDLDGMPLRCPTDFLAAYPAVAARHQSAIVLECGAVLRRNSPRGSSDNRLFHDAQHPTLLSYVALAQALLEALHAHHAFGWPESTPTPVIDPAACAQHFGMDRARWEDVCRKTALFYQATGTIRFDGAQRLARMEQYRNALSHIAAGNPAGQAGIAGLGVAEKRPALNASLQPASPSRPH